MKETELLTDGEAHVKHGKRNLRSWYADRLRAALIDTEQAMADNDASRRKRVLDFFLAPGRITAKIHDDAGLAHRVEIEYQQLDDSTWGNLLRKLSVSAVCPAKLLSGLLPPELADNSTESNILLFPANDEILFLLDGSSVQPTHQYVRPVLEKFFDVLESDPFAIFILRGRGRDEIILELLNLRNEKRRSSATEQRQNTDVHHQPEATQGNLEEFWSARRELFHLTYDIKADELPAAILRRLDPLPLDGLEEEVEFPLEEAYVQVTRRAQAFGLGMTRGDHSIQQPEG